MPSLDRKRFIDSISLSLTFFLFGIILLSIKSPGYFWFLTIPVQFFWALAGLSFFLFIIFSVSLFATSIMNKYERLFSHPPVSPLRLTCWKVFLGILWLAIFIGLVGGVVPLLNLLPEILRFPILIITLVWPIIVVIALFANICRDRKETAESVIESNEDEALAQEPTQRDIGKQAMIELPSIGIVLEEARRRLDFQFDQLDGLSTKSGIVLGVAGVIFTLLVMSLLGESSIEANLVLAKVALIPIFASLVVSFVPIYIIKWHRPPNVERLREHYIVEDVETTQLNIIDKCLEAIENNEKLLKNLARLIKCSYFLLLIGLASLAVWIGMII